VFRGVQVRLLTTIRGQTAARPGSSKTLVAANTIAILALIAAFVFLVVLGRDNLQLRKETMELKSTVATISGTIVGPASVQIGDIVPSFDAVSLEGKPTSIVYDGSSRYLLYLFSVRCGVCENEVPKWNEIASRGKLKNYKVFGVSIDPEDAKGELNKLDRNFDLLLLQSKSVQRAYRVVAIPLVMIVSGEGTVEWVHYGAMSEGSIRELSSLLDSK
jgi:peroxiredoxin